MEITNIDSSSVELKDGEFSDELLTLAGADEIAEGTILARDSASGKLVPFVAGGVANENGIPKAVLTYHVSAPGAGDVPIRALVKGVVDRTKLIIDADGDGTNVTNAVVDQLRDYGITAIPVQELARIDNPQS